MARPRSRFETDAPEWVYKLGILLTRTTWSIVREEKRSEGKRRGE